MPSKKRIGRRSKEADGTIPRPQMACEPPLMVIVSRHYHWRKGEPYGSSCKMLTHVESVPSFPPFFSPLPSLVRDQSGR